MAPVLRCRLHNREEAKFGRGKTDVEIVFKVLHNHFLRLLASECDRLVSNAKGKRPPTSTLKPATLLEGAENVWTQIRKSKRRRKRNIRLSRRYQ